MILRLLYQDAPTHIEFKVRPKTTIARLKTIVEEMMARCPECPLGAVLDWGCDSRWETCADLPAPKEAEPSLIVTWHVDGPKATEQQRVERQALADSNAQILRSMRARADKDRLLALHQTKPLKALWAALIDPQFAVSGDISLPMAIVMDRRCGIECVLSAKGGGRGFLRKLIPSQSFADVTPLMLATFAGRIDVMKALIAGGAELKVARNYRFLTPLLAAAAVKNPAAIELLVSHGATIPAYHNLVKRYSDECNPLAVDEYQNTLLHIAAMSAGCTGSLIQLLVAKGIPVDVENAQRKTPIWLAALNSLEALRGLIDVGASLKPLYTPLVAASRSGNVDAVKLLIANAADVNGISRSEDRYDRPPETPIGEAVSWRRTDVVKILLDNDADVNTVCGRHARSLLHVSSSSERQLRLLLEAGADVNAIDLELNTALHVIGRLESGLAERMHILDLLLSHGAEVNAVNARSQSALDTLNALAKSWQKGPVMAIVAAEGGKRGEML